ncbi:hypothetical protein [Rothia dentocariosa]|uniref:hypothetical protein n=1 Tax=Rothia dentocariosa TaxID=2047 RepID=UPI001C54F5A7|nr:hypothetical protein [Rothia dentocariosa]
MSSHYFGRMPIIIGIRPYSKHYWCWVYDRLIALARAHLSRFAPVGAPGVNASARAL